MIICNCEECIFCKDKACIIEVGDIAITIDKNGSCFNKVIPDKVCKSAKSNIKRINTESSERFSLNILLNDFI